MASAHGATGGVLVRGIRKDDLAKVIDDIKEVIGPKEGNTDILVAGQLDRFDDPSSVFIGRTLARDMSLRLGEK